jgi:cytochrome c
MLTRLLPAALALVAATSLASASLLAQAGAITVPPRVLVFSRTAGFRHSSIETGVATVRALGKEMGFAVDATEDAGAFTDRTLQRYRAIVFMSTTGDVLNDAQQASFERYIQAGGGYVGIHSATDTEYEWPWYGRLAGAYFTSHPNNPNVRAAAFRTIDSTHVSTRGLPARWQRTDEFYNFKSIDPGIHVLVDIDETSYEGGTNGAHHPMSWYHDFDGGRAWYTAMGHTEETYAEAPFLTHLEGGLRYAMGNGVLDYRRARPEENRFTPVVLAEKFVEPIELAVLPDERVLFIERRGAIKLYTPRSKRVHQIGVIPVSLTYTTGERAEDGLLGLALDPGFATNGWIYLYYSPEGPEPKNVLARYHMRGDSIEMSSARILLEITTQREQCCHTGGSIAFDGHGNLFLSTGDNTNPFATGYAPIDERAGRGPWDAQKSSGNTNDLRGKIIRIHPETDGTYTIPDGNLFPPGTPLTRPEIYTMGHRNPYRIAVDPHTGVLYWGDVGPDASVDSTDRGPKGHDEVNRAARPGNYGWPYFVGDNKAYRDLDQATMNAGPAFDPQHPVNDSPNNTGMRDLPPAMPAFYWYSAGPSVEFPLVATGGRTAMAGPVIHRQAVAGAARPFPNYYDGKLLTYEWMRGWIMAVTMDSAGHLASMERFMPSHKFSNPIDMAFGPNGDLYVLEYGTTWFSGNDDSRLIRIEFNAGNRAPVAVASVDRAAGALPLRVRLSAAGSRDADEDSLRYAWTVRGRDGAVVRRLTGTSPALTLAAPGRYSATLTVRDARGARGTAEVQVAAGNEPPRVGIDLAGGNGSFFFPGRPVQYAVRVTDREDGSLARGTIARDRVRVTAEYVAEAPVAGASGSTMAHAEGRRLIEAGTCLSCHNLEKASVGPAYNAVAAKYKGDSGAVARLARKIRGGGSGVWGPVMMPPHPQLTDPQAREIVRYILSLADTPTGAPSLPVQGSYTPPDSAAASPTGAVVLRASYADRGGNGLLGAVAETTVVLRAPQLVVATTELSDGVQRMTVPQVPVEITIAGQDGQFAKLSRLDLSGIGAVQLAAQAPAAYGAAGGKVEVRLDSATGPLIGVTPTIAPSNEAAPTLARATLQPTRGMHDVYLVFRKEGTAPSAMLFVLLTATFESTAGAGGGGPGVPGTR